MLLLKHPLPSGILLLATFASLCVAPAYAGPQTNWFDGKVEEGPYDGYWKYDEVVTGCNAIVKNKTNLVSKIEIGQSLQSRPIPVLALTDTVNLATPLDKRPSMLVTALTRGNEPMSASAALELAKTIVNEPQMAALLATTKLYVVPMLNVDGSISGKAKNMRPGCKADTSKGGVDLAANWNFAWDLYLPNKATSQKYTDECSPNYHGDDEFSEPETNALQEFVTNVAKPRVAVFLRDAATANRSRLVIPYTYHPSNSSVQRARKLFTDADAATYDGIVSTLTFATNSAYIVGTEYDARGTTLSGSDLDWTFDQAGAFALGLEIGTKGKKQADIHSVLHEHVRGLMALLESVPKTPSKLATPAKGSISKHIGKAILNIPLILGAIAAVLLFTGYLIARFLGYDKIWDRFALAVHRLRRWRMYRNYRSLQPSGKEEEEEGDEEFGWDLDGGLGEEGGAFDR